jgi:ribonucleoside-triphosphate reductase
MFVDKYESSSRKSVNFIKKYTGAKNAASGSEVDSNANVETKNITTMGGEIHKKDNIYTNRLMMYDKIKELYDTDLAEEYLRQLETHEIYRHDESGAIIGTPYCASISMYPFLLNGLKGIGGKSGAPKHLRSFCGGFINLVFAVSSQLAGACSTPEFLSYLDYFIRKEYGNEYYLNTDKIINSMGDIKTVKDVINACFDQVVYSINQPAAARGYQSVFWNLAYFDKYYFEQLFGEFVFPDGTKMPYESVNWIQKEFIRWFNNERTKEILTFPVESASLLNDGKDYADKDWKDFVAEMYSKGHSFFTYTSPSVDSLSSCCRLRNEFTDNTFSYTLGAGGVSTGSKCVMTININRLVQNATKNNIKITDAIYEQTNKIHKYLIAFNEIVKDMQRLHMIQIYDAGFIDPKKQYLTIGINGLVEGAEFLGIEISPNKEYEKYVKSIFETIYNLNKEHKTNEIMFNTEQVPAENLGIKNAKWDKENGYFVPRDCYNSYIYLVEDPKVNVLDKFKMHGGEFTSKLDGGCALHINLEEHLSKEQYEKLLEIAIKTGCSYFTFNVPNTICNDCSYISKNKLKTCSKCGSSNLDYAVRIIGYLKMISSFSEGRQEEESKRVYH